ncbi:16S rRNA (guanine(966)-N(2))-methyltransferase RsmD [Pelagibacterales bacterium SAG-MED16]|nr:16S rRNA (guanine(966)-N(2))-methyltransferase RsmD [Pelagibacterales bacterium SAG-MED16]
MRIIGGDLKGKKLLIPLDKSTRPLKDMVRESIFNILNHSSKVSKNINNSKVLDLFSGTGSFGIECLSRGAKEVIFFENYSNSLKILKKNIFNSKLEDKTKVYERNAYDLKETNLKNEIFDIIFLDPPFKDKEINILINQIKMLKIANINTLIIIHRNKKSVDNISKLLNILDEKNYGLSKILFSKLI